MTRLGDVCQVISGTTPKTSNPNFWDGDINWITPAELSDDSQIIYESQRKITELAVKSGGLKPMPAGTVILSSRAPIGKVAIAGGEMYCNQGFKNLICSDAIFNKYLFWYLKSRTDYLNTLGRGATFKEISKEIVENVEVPLPSISVQQHIATVLDKLSDLISLHKQQLTKLDELVKAQFVEMFGDLTRNTMNWEFAPLAELCDVRDGTHDSPKYCLDGYPLLTSKNFTNGVVNFSDANLISKEDFDTINQRSKVDFGDIVMPMIGTIGHPVIIDTHESFAIKNVALIKFFSNGISNIFIREILDSSYFRKIVQEENRGNTQKFIALGDIRKLMIPLVPIAQQNIFSAFVDTVNMQRLTIQQGLDKMELIKKSLMQKYFGC